MTRATVNGYPNGTSPQVPASTLTRAQAAILAALWHVYADDGRATVRAVAAEAGRSVATTYHHLGALAALGLVAGIGDGTMGALRPAVWPVEVVPARRAAA